MRRSGLVLALLLVALRGAGGQIIREPVQAYEPLIWGSLSIGWYSQQRMCHPPDNICWNGGSAAQWRATVETPVGEGAYLGFAANTARVPTQYSGPDCGACPADVRTSQYLGLIRIGRGTTFHQVVDIGLGATVYDKFTSTTGTALGTGKAISLFSFAIGIGFGYSVTDWAQFMVVQEFGAVFGKRVNTLSNNSSEQRVIRGGLRMGF